MKLAQFSLVLITLITCCDVSIAQERLLKKSWIKESIEDFRGKHEEPDTMYMRYVFNKSMVLFGFDPGWHYMQMPYAVSGNTLTLGVDQWTIETLTDTTLTIFLAGFKRIKFVAEDYLQSKDEYLVQIGTHGGKPLYKANRVITARYEKPNPLIDDVKKKDRSDDYNIRKAGTFLMSFIVTSDGKIEDPKVLKGVASGFDQNIIKELLRTSKRWSPAMFKVQPIQTLMLFEIKFLDSLDEY